MQDLRAELQAHFGSTYRIVRELEGGGMSRVFVAQDAALDRTVAIKVLPERLAMAVSVERFRREIMLSAALQHPHIVPVLSAGEIEGLPYFIMPFVEGNSLRTRIARGPLSIRETVGIMRDVARALEYAHAQGVVHRDIKPDNILLSAGAATVTDFGVAKAITASSARGGSMPAGGITGVGFSIGTPAYMAPEQAAADPRTDHRADLYALGVVAYEMLVGAPPFHARTPQAILTAHLTEQPPPLGARRYDVPAALATLISACLEKDPARRPASAAKVVRALDDPAAVSGTLVAAPPVRAETRRRKRTLVAIVVSGLALAAFAGFATWRWSAGAAAPESLTAGAAVASTPSRVSQRSIAVLPMRTIGGDSVAIRFAEGVTAQLHNRLSRAGGLHVVSSTSASAATSRLATSAEIGQVLGVALLVEGTAQHDGERVRLTVRAVRVANDSTLWSETYDRASGDLFAAQDDVAGSMALALLPLLLPPGPEGDGP